MIILWLPADDVGWFEVVDEELREESDREEVGDNEPEEDAVSIHRPEEEELWVNCMANHLTRPRWVAAESERKIVQLNGATGTTLQKEPIGTCNDPHICVPLHDIYIILFAPVAIHAFNNLHWYILCLKINICSMLKKTYILSYFWNSTSTSSSDVAT